MYTARQTVSYLRRRFREVGLEPDRRHGQNFLIDLNLIDVLATAAELETRDVVLEVGTGMGSLTAQMAPLVHHVVTVEIDQHLAGMASEELAQFGNVTLLQQDALKNKNTIHPLVQETVMSKIAEAPGSRLKLAANLPYNIATPLISNLLHWETPPVLLAVTIQKELADRMMAVPSTKDYSALSIWIQSLATVELVRVLPPGVFWPTPKVDSAIIRIVPDPARRGLIPDLVFYHQFVRALFFHRRKFLRSVLISAFKERLDKKGVDEVLTNSPYRAEMRAEELSVGEIQDLAERFRQRVVQPDSI